MLTVKKITADFPDLEKVEALAHEAYPPAEYLAPAKLIELAQSDDFDFLAVYDGARFVGFVALQNRDAMVYLYFLAIDPACRCMGYGGQTLALLETLYPGCQQIVDIEMPDDAAPNRAQRQRRRGFYLRNGYRPTGQFLSYFGMDFELLCKDDAFDCARFLRMAATLKIDGFHPVPFRKDTEVPSVPGVR